MDPIMTDGARRALRLADEEARRLGRHCIGTEELLLGLVRETEGLAAAILARHSIGLPRVRSIVWQPDYHDTALPPAVPVATSEIGLTPRAQRIVDAAGHIARDLKHKEVRTGHLLLSLIQDMRSSVNGDGSGTGTIVRAIQKRISLETLCQEIKAALEDDEVWVDAGAAQRSAMMLRQMIAEQPDKAAAFLCAAEALDVKARELRHGRD